MPRKKRYITIHIIPDDSSQTWTLRLRFLFFEFLFYAIIIALFAIGFAALKITEINGKVLTAEHLAETNRALMAKQEKMVLLERELAKIVEQEKRIRSIMQGLVRGAQGEHPAVASRFQEKTEDYLQDYISEVRALEKRRLPGGRVPDEKVPDIWPVAGIVSQGFRLAGPGDPGHPAIDIIAAGNDMVVSSARGIVVASGWDRDLGKFVKVDHGTYQTVYGHLSRTFVQTGDHLSKGSSLGIVGSTGNSRGPHLHYEVFHKGQPINPQQLLN